MARRSERFLAEVHAGAVRDRLHGLTEPATWALHSHCLAPRTSPGPTPGFDSQMPRLRPLSLLAPLLLALAQRRPRPTPLFAVAALVLTLVGSARQGRGQTFQDPDLFVRNTWTLAQLGIPTNPAPPPPGGFVFSNDGTKAYLRPDRHLNLFRPEKNAERLNRSAARMAMPAMDVEEQVQAMAELVRLEHAWTPGQDGAALYIRPVMIGLDTTLEVRASRSYLFYVILSPVAPYFAGGFKPVSVLVSDDFVRTVRGGTGEAKTPGNYAGSLRGTARISPRPVRRFCECRIVSHPTRGPRPRTPHRRRETRASR